MSSWYFTLARPSLTIFGARKLEIFVTIQHPRESKELGSFIPSTVCPVCCSWDSNSRPRSSLHVTAKMHDSEINKYKNYTNNEYTNTQ